ncbi:hypothetical protein K439DRAFT_1554494, partial [Ramaria rubella]
MWVAISQENLLKWRCTCKTLKSLRFKKVNCVTLEILGPHYEWNANGHDKLSVISFPVWGVQDVWLGSWLGLWVVLNNCIGFAVAYLYLSLVEELSGKHCSVVRSQIRLPLFCILISPFSTYFQYTPISSFLVMIHLDHIPV